MQIHEAAKALQVSPRTLRHYEAAGLLTPSRGANGYRIYTAADLKRAERIRDMIATGYSVREISALGSCLDQDDHRICLDAITGLKHKLEQIERLMADLTKKRRAVIAQLDGLEASLGNTSQASQTVHDITKTSVSVSHRFSGRSRRIPPRTDPDAHRG